MRLNKKKLAALAMSAVMAASTMPFPVLAEEFTDGGEATVATAEDLPGSVIPTATATFDGVGNATIHYADGTTKTQAATYVVVQEKTCDLPEKKAWRTYDSVTNQWFTSEPDTTATATGHTDEAKWEVTTGAGCETTGTKTEYNVCKTCGRKVATGRTQTIPAEGHSYGEPYTEITSRTNVDAGLNLIDKSQDGSYVVTTYEVCTKCGDKHVRGTETKYVYSSQTGVVSYKKTWLDSATCNITGGITNGAVVTTLPADNSIVLAECDKNGEYWVTSYDEDDHVVATEKHVVPAHHNESVSYVAVKTEEQSLLTPVVVDGKRVVKNTSCYKTVKYKEVTTCLTERKVISTVEKEAKPEGSHVNTSMAASREWLKNAVDADGYVDAGEYAAIMNATNQKEQNYKATVTGDCGKEVAITVTYYCEACGEALPNPVTVKCKVLSHNWTDPEITNKVEPTCSKDGSYDTVKTCRICGKKEVVRTGVKIPATGKHSFIDSKTGKTDYTNAHVVFTGTKVVDIDGENLINKGKEYEANGLQSAYRVSAAATIKCETCGEKVVQNSVSNPITVIVDDITKETAKEAGSITLRATWYTPDNKTKVEETKTVPYYSSISAYFERDPEKDPINGLHKDEDGVWRYYENNEVTDFTGIAEYQGGKFFVANGVLCSDAKGLNLYNGEWYFLAGGQIQTQVTGLAMYNGEWFFLTNGKLDRSKTGLVEYDGAKFIIAKGELQRYSGLWQDPADGTWYFAALGQIQEQYTGTAIYDGQTFELVNGKLVR